MQDLESWSHETSERYRNMPPGDLRSHRFMRDPPRATRVDRRSLFAPADGIVIHADVIDDPAIPVEIKGANYSIAELVAPFEPFDEPCAVVGIFMTFYDVHINRMPSSGAVNWRMAESVKSYNRPMLFVENDVLDDDMRDAYTAESAYLKDNARCVNRIGNGDLYYDLVQIADLDVDVITPFAPRQSYWFSQGQRFSMVRWGSQVELIVPARFAEIEIEETMHVEAGKDVVMVL